MKHADILIWYDFFFFFFFYLCDTAAISGAMITTITTKVQNHIRNMRNPGRDISLPIFIRKEIETRKLERKSKQKISRLIDLLYRLKDISRKNDIK